jgi:hypothetical protein
MALNSKRIEETNVKVLYSLSDFKEGYIVINKIITNK